MGQEQGKVVRQNNQNGKQIKSCNQLEDQSPNRGLSPSKNVKPQSSTNLSINDLQTSMNLENYELVEIMEYLKKNKYYLDQTILGKGGNGYVLKAIKVLKCETEDQYLQNQAEYENLNISQGYASLSQPEKQYIIPSNGALLKKQY